MKNCLKSKHKFFSPVIILSEINVDFILCTALSNVSLSNVFNKAFRNIKTIVENYLFIQFS